MNDQISEVELAKMWNKMKDKDPQWELRVEFGAMLLKQYETMTPQELQRYNELLALLK